MFEERGKTRQIPHIPLGPARATQLRRVPNSKS